MRSSGRLRQTAGQSMAEADGNRTRQRRIPPLTGFEVPFWPVWTLEKERFERGLARSGGWREVENGAVVAREWHDQQALSCPAGPAPPTRLKKYVRFCRSGNAEPDKIRTHRPAGPGG